MRKIILHVVMATALLLPNLARAQDRSVGFTTWGNISQVTWSTALKRRALIIGNGTYDPAGDGDQKPPPRPLHNLPNPCGDARLIAQSLVASKWQPSEIAVACDQASSDISTALQALYDSLPADPKDDQITFVYFAGHGMQIGSNDYFFGKNARPDFVEAASRLEYNPGVRVFTAETADPIGFFTGVFGGNRTRRAILIIIDACRDDPLFDNIKQSLLSKAKSVDLATQEQINQTARSITAPAGGGIDFPTGMKVVFGSKVGHVVEDDDGIDGHSRLSSFLAIEIQKDQSRTANAIVSATLDDVEDSVRGTTDEQFRRAEALGELEGDPCLSQCSQSVETASPPDRAQPRLQHTGFQSQDALVEEADSATLASVSTPTLPAKTSKSTVEIFWCATGGASDDGRERSAERLAQAIQVDQGLGHFPSLSIKVSELKSDENSKPGFQVNDDSLLFDPQNAALGREIHNRFPGLRSISIKGNASSYIAAYYCKGTYPGPVSATVYLQVPDSSLLNYSSIIIDKLKKEFPNLYVQPDTEVRRDSPNDTQLRFFDERKRVSVDHVADALQLLTGVSVRRPLFRRLTSVKSINQYEIWIGKNDVERVKASLLSISSTD